MAVLRLFAAAREAAGTGRSIVDGRTVEEVLGAAVNSFGPSFGAVLPSCRVWVNGEPAESSTEVDADDEVAVLPPVSGGCR
ncbi:MAG: MoaD/ThiS family protein [Ilumatobacteraceae bacterium]